MQLAQQLGGEQTAEEYRRLVYERKQAVHFDSPSNQFKETLGRWSVYMLWALAGLIVLFDVFALLANEDQLDVALGLIGALFPVLLPAGLIGVAATLGARFLTATTTVESPDSEEQFETLFSGLLREQRVGVAEGNSTLVVFIDELDRCSAVEVARTLESLKTFLGDEGCIFVVAADRNVLEHALTRRVRQATPHDTANPYYSAGSAYLDKIFQYQIHLPPLFPGRLTGFALKLLEDVGGSWDEVKAKEDVVSVLLPVTVRSPRRVKVLLNAFAQAFALTLARASSKNLDQNVKSRAVEVAKLVGLQIEFPLFAADLTLNPDLPSLVLACADALADGHDQKGMEGLDAMQGVPDLVRERAISYAEGKLPTAEILNDADTKAMHKAQGGDLIDYLRQTALVDGPATDLVHFEGLGLAAGIDEALALELNDLALKNRPELVSKRLTALDDEERQRAFLWLRSLVRESRGNDADNAIRALLISFSGAGAAMPRVATDLLAAVAQYDRKRGLAVDELPSALELAIVGHGRHLQSSILQRPQALEDPLRSFALDRAPLLLEAHAEPLGEMLLREMLDLPADATIRLRQAKVELRGRLAQAAAGALREQVGRSEALLSRDDIGQFSVDELTAELTRLVEGASTQSRYLLRAEDQESAEVLLTPILARVGGPFGLELIEAVLDDFSRGETVEFNIALARWLSHQATEVFVRFVPKLNGKLLLEHAVFQLGEVLARLWHEAGDEDSELAGRGIAQIGELAAEGVEVASKRIREEARGSLAGPVANQADVERRRTQIELLEQMAEAGLLSASGVATEVTDFAGQMMRQAAPAGLEAALASLLAESLGRVVRDASADELEGILDALPFSAWLSEQSPYFETIQLQIEAALSSGKISRSPFEPARIAELSEAHGEQFIPALALWLEKLPAQSGGSHQGNPASARKDGAGRPLAGGRGVRRASKPRRQIPPRS